MNKIIIENVKTIFYALVIAIIIRSLILQPFYIPSSSMEPNLLVGDRLFVTKYSYGYSKHSFPFSPPIIKGRIFSNLPKRGDVIVFKTPSDNRTDYIKRLIGLPGDEIEFIEGELYLNGLQIFKNKIKKKREVFCGDKEIDVNFFEESLDTGITFDTAYLKNYTFQNSDKFIVPDKHYFFLGDNRDCSKDSRFLSSVGYVHQNNLVGKAQFIFFSTDVKKGRLFQVWKWGYLIRFERIFKKII
tara:strand:- start:149 stop:877 length:729 start_codon:yes stop_codon:yes gene_type:complete